MRILVADDHALFRDGLVSLLEAADYEVVAQVENGERAVEAAIRLQPEVVLLDITMPELDGLEALRRLRQELPGSKLVILTVSDDEKDLADAIRAGANGYLLKSLDADEFLDLLKGLQRGEAAITRKMTTKLMAGMAHPVEDRPDPLLSLTPREIELLGLVQEGRSNLAIAQQLLISENTVKYHLKNIFQKLGVQNRTEAVAHAFRAGLLPSTYDTYQR
ncbi:MAG: response regulator transcription factor [Anaerolineales bacterium]|nr:MAG: response regulator transcription factor [Anaerolineales bacterium]